MPAKRGESKEVPGEHTTPSASPINKARVKTAKVAGDEPAGVVICEDGLARTPWAASDPLLRAYYDTEWGMPVRDERGLFELLAVDGLQSGLSWITILRNRDAFRAAFDNFVPEKIAAYDEGDVS